ncbi:MAG: hypothetical protein HOV80_24150 [Polyangiaceae bacterium]|nr:hypothetical protein [Polyangiaceae bacterium]
MLLQALRFHAFRTLPFGVVAVLLAACNVTSDGSTGDPQSDPDSDVLGDGARVAEVVGPATWFSESNMTSQGCATPRDRQVRITGQTIVAVDRYDETGDGALGNIYVQDVATAGEAPVPFSGLTVFSPSFTPPDLRVFEGDVVDTFGNLIEFLGPTSPFGGCRTLPEIGGAMSLRFDAAPAEPATIVTAGTDPTRFDPIKGYPNARQWIGMLVRIEGVTLTENGVDDGKGRYTAGFDIGGGITGDDIVKISNELFDMKGLGPTLTQGAQFKAVTGVFTYFYGFKIAPRSAEDFEL